jgi:hypothetical protein
MASRRDRMSNSALPFFHSRSIERLDYHILRRGPRKVRRKFRGFVESELGSAIRGIVGNMASAGRIDFDDPAPINEGEDDETLAAIDEGIGDAEAGRTVPMDEVRGLLPKWIAGTANRTEARQREEEI